MSELVHLLEYNYEMPETSGIYLIKNNINNKGYVGQASYLPSRAILYSHDHCTPLKKAYEKYGLENFSVILLEECSRDLLDEREIYWISELHTWIGDPSCSGYNLTKGGRGFRGVTDDIRLKRSQRMIGNKINLGRKASEETRAKLRASAPKTHSPEHNKHVSESLKAKGIRPPGMDSASLKELLRGNKYLLGKKFIHRGDEKRAVPESEVPKYLQEGWILGRGKNRKKV